MQPAKGCGCSRQRRPAPIRRRGGGLRRADGAANGSEGAGARESWRLPRAWPGSARAACDRRGRVSRPTWGRVRLPHQQKRAAGLRWSSSAHSECLMCGRARYQTCQGGIPCDCGGRKWTKLPSTSSKNARQPDFFPPLLTPPGVRVFSLPDHKTKGSVLTCARRRLSFTRFFIR